MYEAGTTDPLTLMADYVRVVGAAFCGAAIYLCLTEVPRTLSLYRKVPNWLSLSRLIACVLGVIGGIGMIAKAAVFLVDPVNNGKYTPIAAFFGGGLTTVARACVVPTIVRRSFVGMHFKVQVSKRVRVGIELAMVATCLVAFSLLMTGVVQSLQRGTNIAVNQFYSPMFRVTIGVVSIFQAVVSVIGDINLLGSMKTIRTTMGADRISSSIMISIVSGTLLSIVQVAVGLASVIAPQYYFPLDVFVAPMNLALTIVVANEFHAILTESSASRPGSKRNSNLVSVVNNNTFQGGSAKASSEPAHAGIMKSGFDGAFTNITSPKPEKRVI